MLGLLRYAKPLSLRTYACRRQRRRYLRLEELEARTVLSATYSPSQIAHAYGFDQLPPYLDGTGQTIAIVDAYGSTNPDYDLRTFDAQWGLPDLANGVMIAQPEGKPFSNNLNWGLETDLDVQWAHAMAPGANILLVEARNASLDNLMQAVQYASQQPGVVAVSMSWGSLEFADQTQYNSYFTTPSGHIGGSGLPGGVTFVAASGDSGGIVEWPAASSYVLSVGGTTLTLDGNNQIVSETGWWQSGGGISSYEPQPLYQASLPQPYPMRTVPDVSYNADMMSSYWVYDSDYGGTQAVYGTSAGAPQWAALVALADQALALNNIGSLDGLTQTIPALYALASSASYTTYFNDIQIGNNGFPAGPGYDLVTGLGSPLAAQLVPGIVSLQSPGGNARMPQGFDLNPLADSNVTGASIPPVQAPRLVTTPGHPGTSQKTPGMQAIFTNEPVVLLLPALANTSPGHGPLVVGIPSATNPGLHSVMEGNTPIPLAFPPLTSSSGFSVSRIESGGGDNGLLIDDSEDAGPVENALPSVSNTPSGVTFLDFSPRLGGSSDVGGSGPEMTASCFFAEQPNYFMTVSRQATLSSATYARDVLPDPLAAAGALTLALGGYWVKPAGEIQKSRRRVDQMVVLPS